MTEPDISAKNAAKGDVKPTAQHEKAPAEVTVSEGLHKIFEADAALTPEQVDAMAEQAKAAAKQSQDARDDKQAQLDTTKDR
ncbi:hypothetical protein SJI19_12600 [Acerihabitans sp. TG2]|uniref:hypothetical protein n=1 Tax=Acerihabitans sp. TG2 TaxID=3096008 RepID=UPI002B2300F9|nr:hypothetical protein [Acerihabitans sp. TG2]MEA9391372.1 hypothetical protein [Acerihabitans sp. TG2]